MRRAGARAIPEGEGWWGVQKESEGPAGADEGAWVGRAGQEGLGAYFRSSGKPPGPKAGNDVASLLPFPASLAGVWGAAQRWPWAAPGTTAPETGGLSFPWSPDLAVRGPVWRGAQAVLPSVPVAP